MRLPGSSLKNIAIFRALQLGDMLCAVPAARALRHAYPNAMITLLGLPWASSFCTRFNMYFDRFLHFPGYPGLPEQDFDAEEYQTFVQRVRNEQFDLVLQMQGNGTIVNEMISGWGAETMAGFRLPGTPAPSPWFLEYPEGIHEINRHLALMQHLGIATQGTSLEFPITDQEEDQMVSLNLPYKKGEYVVIHPGSRGSYRQWPPAHFAEAASVCYEAGYQVVLTGTPDEHDIVARVINELDIPYYNACGKTGLGTAAILIRDAALIICNCTGVSHIASAMKTPGIIISMDGEPERWGPLDKDLQTTINWLQQADPDKVFKQIRNKLSDLHSPAEI